jgi:hypothetical protein
VAEVVKGSGARCSGGVVTVGVVERGVEVMEEEEEEEGGGS